MLGKERNIVQITKEDQEPNIMNKGLKKLHLSYDPILAKKYVKPLLNFDQDNQENNNEIIKKNSLYLDIAVYEISILSNKRIDYYSN